MEGKNIGSIENVLDTNANYENIECFYLYNCSTIRLLKYSFYFSPLPHQLSETFGLPDYFHYYFFKTLTEVWNLRYPNPRPDTWLKNALSRPKLFSYLSECFCFLVDSTNYVSSSSSSYAVKDSPFIVLEPLSNFWQF